MATFNKIIIRGVRSFGQNDPEDTCYIEFQTFAAQCEQGLPDLHKSHPTPTVNFLQQSDDPQQPEDAPWPRLCLNAFLQQSDDPMPTTTSAHFLHSLPGLHFLQPAVTSTAFLAWPLTRLALTPFSSGGQDRAGVAIQPALATTSTNIKPDTDNLGLELFVITIVILLANRPARPEVIPIPITGIERKSSRTYSLVFSNASA